MTEHDAPKTPPSAAETSLLLARARVPEHVVYRAFGNETIVLNLRSGSYHGLNSTAARMLEAVDAAATLGAAAATLAYVYGRDADEIGTDLAKLCADLAERGVIELDPAAAE